MPRVASLLLLVCAGLALVLLGVRLQGMFVEERDAGKVAIVARQRALEQYAVVALEKRLDAALEGARARIDAALADPLAAEEGLLLVEDGVQRLPRLHAYRDGTATPGTELYRELAGATAAASQVEEGPWSERVALLADLRDALRRADDRSITAAVRTILDHQSRYVVPVTQEVPYRLAFLEVFTQGASPDPALLEALLRDGLRGTRGRRLAGLQSLLLSHRERFTEPDFRALSAAATHLSRTARVVHDDFAARAAEGRGQALPVPEALKARALLAGGAWYAEPLEVKGIRGVAVHLDPLLADITGEMRRGQLIGATDTILPREAPSAPVTELAPSLVHVRSDSFAQEAMAIDQRYAVKTATGVALVTLIFAVGFLTHLLYRREQKLLEGKARFVSTVSHELRTPIASLRLMGETLERRLEGVESARDFPSRIVAEADRLGFLVENILSFNRLEKARITANRQRITVEELLEQPRLDAAAFTTKPFSLQIETGGDEALFVDPELVRLVFTNLVNNSCKYTTRDTVDVVVRALRSGANAVVTFSDNGTGIPRDEWESVFTEFVRSRTSDKARGFGLGLALCRRILTLHDGRIRVAASGEAGTTFELTFPGESSSA